MIDVPSITEWSRGLVVQATEIWNGGGWAMYPLGFVALVLFATAVHLHLLLRERRFLAVRERRWRRWILASEERRGPIGELMDFVDTASDGGDPVELFRQLRIAELVPFERELRVVRICVTAAPLLGLLGTVTGMLTTFSALSTGQGGEKTMGMIAAGISEALITTQTGLVIALVGLFMQYQLARKIERYRAFLAHLETVWIQTRFAAQQGGQRGAQQGGRNAVGAAAQTGGRRAGPTTIQLPAIAGVER